MVELNADLYESEGGGAPLLIAHGLFGQARNFASMAKKLSARRPVACVDMRNHGQSPWSDVMDYEPMGADLLEAAERLFGRPPVLLGHSMGGKSAMAAALISPKRVAGLLVADIAPVAYRSHDHSPFVAAMAAADLTSVERRSQVEAQLKDTIPDPMLRAFLMQSLAVEEQDGAKIARWKLNLEVLGRVMPTLLSWPDALSDLRNDGPTLFLHGGASDYVTPEAHAVIRRLFPQAEIEPLPGAGHWLHAEKPDAFLEAVEAWLSRVGAD